MLDNLDRLTPEAVKLFRNLEELDKNAVYVGFQAGREQEDDGTDVAQVAAWNEFGTSNTPARPFLRTTITDNQSEIKDFVASVMKEMTAGRMDIHQCLAAIGSKAVGLVQEKIRDGDFEPNAPSTIRRKGSERPLIDTGMMRQSVHYVIGGKEEG